MTIDRAIEILDPGTFPDVSGDEAAEACRMGMEALKRQRWIPVSERLPETDGTYLCVTNKVKRAVSTGRFYSERDVYDYKGNLIGHENGYFQTNRYVTHWMSLPEPPEEGGARSEEK